jgi:hypothetical protein
MEKIFLVLGITAISSILTLQLLDDWMLGFAGIIGIFLLSVLLIDPLESKTKNEEEKEEEAERFGTESRAATDSKIYERPSYLLGVSLIAIAFGGVGSKYESLFSIEHEGKMIVVLYHGLCLVSAGDSLLIRGKWYQGKKLGIQGNVVVADKVENLSSGIVFSKE